MLHGADVSVILKKAQDRRGGLRAERDGSRKK
jgi:hypothetical protein